MLGVDKFTSFGDKADEPVSKTALQEVERESRQLPWKNCGQTLTFYNAHQAPHLEIQAQLAVWGGATQGMVKRWSVEIRDCKIESAQSK